MKYVLFIFASVLVVTSAHAQGLNLSGSSGGVDDFNRKTELLDRRTQSRSAGKISLEPPRAIIPGLFDGTEYDGGYSGPYLELARGAARRHGIPEDLFLRLVQQESAWNQRAVSHKGAIGLAQLMPQTARALGVNPQDPSENLEGGARYLRLQYDRFRTWRLALAAYNAGPEAVERYGGIPPYTETRNYVRKILGS